MKTVHAKQMDLLWVIIKISEKKKKLYGIECEICLIGVCFFFFQFSKISKAKLGDYSPSKKREKEYQKKMNLCSSAE